jgi:hypothetical protein
MRRASRRWRLLFSARATPYLVMVYQEPRVIQGLPPASEALSKQLSDAALNRTGEPVAHDKFAVFTLLRVSLGWTTELCNFPVVGKNL